MKDKYRMFERVNGFRNLLAALPAAFFFSVAMAEDITISQEDIAAGKFPTSTTLTIDSGDNVTLLRGTDYVINIESSTQRWQFLNSGIFNIEAGAYFKVSNANNALSSGMSCNAAGNLNISGEAVFLRYSTSNTASGLWLIYDSYGSGAPGTVTVEDGGILRAYYTNVQGSTNETGTCRIMVGWNSNSQTSSKLVLKAGSTVCAQGIELYKGATLRVEKEV